MITPESRVVGAGELVDHPKKIARHYLQTYFLFDLFVVLPLPQIMILFFLPKHLGTSGANHAKNLLRGAVLAQYMPRLCRFLPMLISPSGFIFESAWASFFINLFTFMLSGHVVGSWWYLFGLQQISTLAGNLSPSYFIWEVLFTMGIIGLGLLLFALLIGNIQNFLQALGRRRLEMSLRQRDVEQWMSHRRLAQDLRRRVRQAERYNWAATRGVNEEILMENLPEDLQRDIRRHLFKFVKKVRIFSLMDEPILDAICERLRQKIYIKGSKILYDGGLVEKVVFIVRGKLESIGEDGIRVPLSEGNVCGEELLTWCLEHASGNK
ncbi:cyclic nucleotide-gated cation channel protein, partial [Trifolium pratense]